MRDNVAQQWWYSTIAAANTIWNTGKFAKMVHLDIFGGDGGRSPYYWLKKLMIVGSSLGWRYWHQNGKSSTLPFPLSSAYYHYFHSLLAALTNAPPPKHCFTNSKGIRSWPRARIIALLFDSLTDKLFN